MQVNSAPVERVPVDPVALLRDLIATPSVNPMGRATTGDIYFEHRMTDRLEQFFTDSGLTTQRQTVHAATGDHPARSNIVARLDGSHDNDRVVLLEAHQDTVPVEGMTVDPFGAVVRDGKIYGRGACDIKGAMAAMLTALARLAAERPEGMPTVMMACTIGEENGFDGARVLPQLWANDAKSIFPHRPDACIIAEPTELSIVVAHKGVVRWRCTIEGRACHSSQPEQGENAIFRMAPVLAALQTYQRDIVPSLGEHPRCGRPTISVGTITGGLSVSTVPGSCTIEIDRRLLPGEDPEEARAHAIAYLAEQLDTPLSHSEPFLSAPGLEDGENRELAAQLGQVARQCGNRGGIGGVPFATDAPFISASGVPTVVCGPGALEQAHTADEFLEVDQLERAVEVYYRWAQG